MQRRIYVVKLISLGGSKIVVFFSNKNEMWPIKGRQFHVRDTCKLQPNVSLSKGNCKHWALPTQQKLTAKFMFQRLFSTSGYYFELPSVWKWF